MAKRLFGLMLTIMVGSFMTKAQESLLVYDGITPFNGSEISSFEFVLKFDLSQVTESNQTGNYGVGWTGYHNDRRPEKEKSVTIYKGEPSDGNVIGRVCGSNYNGGSAGFTASSDVNIVIEGAIPEPGVKYTMVINNEFKVFAVGNAAPIANAVFDCFSNPITYTFVGAAASGDKLTITGCSITANQTLNELSNITFNFNQPITLNNSVTVELKENDIVRAKSKKAVLSDDKTSVTYEFDNIPLLLNQSYVISLPKGAVISLGNNYETNEIFNVPVVGNYVGLFTLKSSNPTSEERTIFSTIEGIFNMPDGLQIYKEPAYALDLTASLYKEEVSEENFVEKFDGKYNSDKNGILWDCTISLEPSTKYVLYKPEREFQAYDAKTGKFSNEWYNGEVLIVLNTPSIEESGFPPIELGDPVIGKHDGGGRVLKNGDSIDSLNLIEIAPVDYFYKGKDGNSNFHLDEDTYKHKGYLYDITTGTPALIKEVSLFRVQRETSRFYYSVISVPLNSVFFEGHRYRFVIPKDEFTILYPPWYNYVRTPEYSIEFNGSTPTEAKLLSCTLQEGEERSSLGNVIWTFKGQFELNPDAEAILERTGYKSKRLLTSDISNSGNTDVVAHIYSSLTGDPLPLHNGEEWTLTLPEGALYYQTDPNIKNKEIVVSFKGIDAKPEVPEPEFVNVEVCIEGVHTTTSETVKGRKLTLTLTPDEFWEVAKLLRDGDDVSPFLEDGRYTTPDLNADTRIEAALKCKANVLLNETPSSVMEITDSNVKVYSDGSHIIVEGLNVGDTVAVYTVNGMLITSQKMTSADNNMQITADTGVVYIVRVNDKAVKIQH